MQQPSSRQSQRCKKMGEKMGPNTLAAFHAGADFMQAKLAAEEDESSDDEALLAGAPLESYGQARMAELREAAERRNKPPGAVLVDPTAWRRLVVDASSDRGILVHLDHPPNPKCATTLEALESIPIHRRGGCELRRVERSFAYLRKAWCLPAIFGYFGGELQAGIGREPSIATAWRLHQACPWRSLVELGGSREKARRRRVLPQVPSAPSRRSRCGHLST